MSWPLRRKLFVTVGGGAAALALVMSLLVNLTVVDEVHELEDRGLLQTQAAFEALSGDISGCFVFQVRYTKTRRDQVAVIHKR